MATARVEGGSGRNTGSPAGGVARRQRTAREGQVGPVRVAERSVGVRQAAHWSGGLKSLRPPDEGAVSKGGGNASPAAGGRYGDTYTGTQAKAGHSQGGPGAATTELREDRAPTVRWGPKGLRSSTGP